MKQKQIHSSISIARFKEMDELAIQKYGLTIELMMENAGLQLALLLPNLAGSSIRIQQRNWRAAFPSRSYINHGGSKNRINYIWIWANSLYCRYLHSPGAL